MAGGPRPEIKWAFWERYERFMREQQGLPPASVTSVADTTDDILARLEAPDRPGAWDRRGLVAGQVQSGKTGNYIGLMTKALDSGYKLVVVLAGVHNSLRSQTQARIDEGILGFDTRKNLRFDQAEGSSMIGVGRVGGRFLPVNSFTSSKQNGDFNLGVARNIGVVVGGNDPIVLVVKKNKSVLTNLYNWATALRKETNPETGRPIVRGVPVLVIDDEADHASVDTNGPKRGQDANETDPTAINLLIRKFLDTFEQSAYVAYTATPFANIFISRDREHRVAGEDLFPRSFIINLPAPSTYLGPARVFGLQGGGPAATEQVDPLPIVRNVTDYDTWLPDGHKADASLQGDLPASLREAMLSFLLGGAVRRLRGQGTKHNSMLVHVTRFTKVQTQVADQVQATLEDFRDRLQFGEGNNPILRAAALDALHLRPPAHHPRAAGHRRCGRARRGTARIRGRLGRDDRGRHKDARPHRQRHVTGRPRVRRSPGRAQCHRHRWRQALARAHPRGAQRQLLPARQQDVRHAHADGAMVRLPPRLPGRVPPLHHPITW